MNKIGIYKYGSCNVHSLVNALEIMSLDFEVFDSISALKNHNKSNFTWSRKYENYR